MKQLLTWCGIILIILACSKSDPVSQATGGCTVSFKGANHSFTIAVCINPTGGSTVDGLSATDVGGTKSFVIARDSADPTSNSLTISTNTSDATGASIYTANVAITSQPTITRTGNNWTFNGTGMNNAMDTGTISGTCTCTN